jgi:hypothetical protein
MKAKKRDTLSPTNPLGWIWPVACRSSAEIYSSAAYPNATINQDKYWVYTTQFLEIHAMEIQRKERYNFLPALGWWMNSQAWCPLSETRSYKLWGSSRLAAIREGFRISDQTVKLFSERKIRSNKKTERSLTVLLVTLYEASMVSFPDKIWNALALNFMTFTAFSFGCREVTLNLHLF